MKKIRKTQVDSLKELKPTLSGMVSSVGTYEDKETNRTVTLWGVL